MTPIKSKSEDSNLSDWDNPCMHGIQPEHECSEECQNICDGNPGRPSLWNDAANKRRKNSGERNVMKICDKHNSMPDMFRNQVMETSNGDRVPHQASFFTGLEKEVKKIIRACEPQQNESIQPKEEATDCEDNKNIGRTMIWKQKAKKGSGKKDMIFGGQHHSVFTGFKKEMDRVFKACKPKKVLKNKLRKKCSKFPRNQQKLDLTKKKSRFIKKEIATDGEFKTKSRGLVRRNWQRISVHPFINFLRMFRRKVPPECPMTIMKLKGREIWRKMDKQQKYPFVEQAIRAKQKGYMM